MCNCVAVNKNVFHEFRCAQKLHVSVLIEPASSLAAAFDRIVEGDYLFCDGDGIMTKNVDWIRRGAR